MSVPGSACGRTLGGGVTRHLIERPDRREVSTTQTVGDARRGPRLEHAASLQPAPEEMAKVATAKVRLQARGHIEESAGHIWAGVLALADDATAVVAEFDSCAARPARAG